MPSRKKRGANKTRKGGSESSGKINVNTFCCSNKTHDKNAWGTSNTNVGTNCSIAHSSQCYPSQYKFRCYKTNPDFTEIPRDEISEKEGSKYEGEKQYRKEDCQYVAGVTGKVVSTVGNVTTAPASKMYNSIFSSNQKAPGGKKSKRKMPKSKRRSTKRK